MLIKLILTFCFESVLTVPNYGACDYENTPLPEHLHNPKVFKAPPKTDQCASKRLSTFLLYECERFLVSTAKVYPPSTSKTNKKSSTLFKTLSVGKGFFLSVLDFHNADETESSAFSPKLLLYKFNDSSPSLVGEFKPLAPFQTDSAVFDSLVKSVSLVENFDTAETAVVAISVLEGVSPLLSNYEKNVFILVRFSQTAEFSVGQKVVAVENNKTNTFSHGLRVCAADKTLFLAGFSFPEKKVFVSVFRVNDNEPVFVRTEYFDKSANNNTAAVWLACERAAVYVSFFRENSIPTALGPFSRFVVSDTDASFTEDYTADFGVVNPGTLTGFAVTEPGRLDVLGVYTDSGTPVPFFYSYQVSGSAEQQLPHLTVKYVFRRKIDWSVSQLRLTSVVRDGNANFFLALTGRYLELGKTRPGEPFLAPQGFVALSASGMEEWVHLWDSHQYYEQQGSDQFCSDFLQLVLLAGPKTFAVFAQKCNFRSEGVSLFAESFELTCPFGTFYKEKLCRPVSTKCGCGTLPGTNNWDCLGNVSAEPAAWLEVALALVRSGPTKRCSRPSVDLLSCLLSKDLDLAHDEALKQATAVLGTGFHLANGKDQRFVASLTDYLALLQNFAPSNRFFVPPLTRSLLVDVYYKKLVPFTEEFLRLFAEAVMFVEEEMGATFYDAVYLKLATELAAKFLLLFKFLDANFSLVNSAISLTVELLVDAPNERTAADILVATKDLFFETLKRLSSIVLVDGSETARFSLDGFMQFVSVETANRRKSSPTNSALGDFNGITDSARDVYILLRFFVLFVQSLNKVFTDWLCRLQLYAFGFTEPYCDAFVLEKHRLHFGKNFVEHNRELRESFLVPVFTALTHYLQTDRLLASEPYLVSVTDSLQLSRKDKVLERFATAELHTLHVLPLLSVPDGLFVAAETTFVELGKVDVVLNSTSKFAKFYFKKNVGKRLASIDDFFEKKEFDLPAPVLSGSYSVFKLLRVAQVDLTTVCVNVPVLDWHNALLYCPQTTRSPPLVLPSSNFSVHFEHTFVSKYPTVTLVRGRVLVQTVFRVYGNVSTEYQEALVTLHKECVWQSGDWLQPDENKKSRRVRCSCTSVQQCYDKEKPEEEVRFVYATTPEEDEKSETVVSTDSTENASWKVQVLLTCVFYLSFILLYRRAFIQVCRKIVGSTHNATF